MLTIEQKQRKELLERYQKARGKYTVEQIREAYGCKTIQNIYYLEKSLKEDRARPGGIRKLTKALDILEGKV